MTMGILTRKEKAGIVKQMADWARTISAGAFILGWLNPAMVGDAAKIALWYVGLPGLLISLIMTPIAIRMEG